MGRDTQLTTLPTETAPRTVTCPAPPFIVQCTMKRVHIYKDEWWPFYGIDESAPSEWLKIDVPDELVEEYHTLIEKLGDIQAKLAAYEQLQFRD